MQPKRPSWQLSDGDPTQDFASPTDGSGGGFTPSWQTPKTSAAPQASAPGSGWGTPSIKGPAAPSASAAPATNGFTDPAQSMYTPSWQQSANGGGSGYGGFNNQPRMSYAGANANGQGGSPTDPIAADRAARQTYSSLKAAGHDVKWQNGQLMVDGRAYTLGTGGGAGQGQSFSSPQDRSYTGGSAQDAGPQPAMRPSGGSIRDPNYARQLISYYAQQPGADPSLASNPDYWVQKMTSGEFGDDQSYAEHKMQTAFHDAPGGGGGSSAMGSVYAPSYAQIQGMGFPQYSAPDNAAPWGADGPAVYTPGEIGFGDIPNFTWESLLQQMRSGRSSGALDDLMTNLLQHPESLDPHTVDSMKAKMKDTLAEQGQFEDQNLKGMGATMGIADSPWLTSERAAATRGKNAAIATGNQNLDITAAQTNMADKRAAAGAGTSYQSMRDSQVMNTVNAGLQRASITGNRLALRESVAQAAAASRQSAQSIMANWIMQNSGLKLSYAQLNSQNSQFLEELMMKVQAMQLQDQQFGADLGFRYGSFNANQQAQPPDMTALGF